MVKRKLTREGRGKENVVVKMKMKEEKQQHEYDVGTSLPDQGTESEEFDHMESQSSQILLHCLVPECGKSQADYPDKVFFMLPSDEEKLHHWLLVCKRTDLIKDFKNICNEQYGICEDHFITDNFSDSSKQTLKYEAIPTLFTKNQREDDPRDRLVFLPGECDVHIKEELPDVYDDYFYGDNDMEEEEDENGNLLCRLCANRIHDVVYIFNDTGQEQQIARKINTCLPVTVRRTDPLPKQLCKSCVAKLNLCHEFAEACIRAEDKLMNLNGNNYFRSEIVSSETIEGISNSYNYRNVKKDKIGVDGKSKCSQNNSKGVTKSTDLHPNKNYCCPLCCNGSMTVTDHEPPSMSDLDGETVSDGSDLQNGYSNGTVSGDVSSELKQEPLLHSDQSAAVNGEDNNKKAVCRICGDLFENADVVIAHATSHFETDFFPCCLCDLCFSTKSSFKEHTKKQHIENERQGAKVRPTKRLTCNSCGKLFNSERTFNGHSCGSSPRPFKCNECGKSFLTELRLSFHQQIHQGGSNMTCEHCGKVFSRENNLFDHVRLVHMGEKAHCCDLCGKTFQLKARLIAHQRVHTGERPFECDVCGGKFYDKATLKGHHLTHLNVKPFQCEKCGRCFARKTLFKQHAVAHLNEERKRPRTYRCRICGGSVVFNSYAKLIEHRREKHPHVEIKEVDEPAQGTKPFKCDECGKSFAYRVTLIAHQRNHTGELPFQCEYCSKKFSQKRSLILHRRTHTGEKPFVCLECGKRFVQSAHLYAHTRLHTGEKPYSCEICNESFRLKDVRDAHQRKHTGERPFKCNVCGKAFRTSHSYYQHMWIHQGKKPYPCSYCGKAFRRSNGLKIHIRIHTGEKPHSCDICGRSFAQKQDMKKHRNLHVIGKL